MAVLVMINNFLHDLGAAGWIIGSVVLWSVLRRADAKTGQGYNVICDVLRTVLTLVRISFVAIVAFGIIRVFTYRNYEWNQAAGHDQVTLLIIKHIFFTVIFLLGLIYYVRACRFVRRTND